MRGSGGGCGWDGCGWDCSVGGMVMRVGDAVVVVVRGCGGGW